MSVEPWFAQPDRVVGTAILLPGRRGGVATPLMHWPATLLTSTGWSVIGVVWDEHDQGQPDESEVRRCAAAALGGALDSGPVLVVAKSLGTLALSWAVENALPGVWLTPLLGERSVREAAEQARQPTLLAGGTDDPHWRVPTVTGTGVEILEIPDADHGLQTSDWRASLLAQLQLFERISFFAGDVLTTAHDAARPGTEGSD